MSLYELFARGGDDEQLFYVEVGGNPWSKSRPRFSRSRRAVYQPRDDQEAEAALRTRLLEGGATTFPGNVMLACRFYRSNYQRIDADNLLKHVCDSATGVLWADDAQVTLVLGEIHLDPDHPRTVIVAGNHRSTLTRGVDAKLACVHCGELFDRMPGRRAPKRFCSTTCAYAARTTVLAPIPCAQCQVQFQPTTARQILCGLACRQAWLHNKRRGQKLPRSKCADCGKELAHTRGGRCRDCWRANPRFYATD